MRHSICHNVKNMTRHFFVISADFNVYDFDGDVPGIDLCMLLVLKVIEYVRGSPFHI